MVIEFSSTGVARLADTAGAEFVLFDMEHTAWSIETVRGLIASCGGIEAVPFVRIPATEYHFAARVLDAGALGVMVPMVNDAEQARRLAAFCRYPPVGRRGATFTVAHDDYRTDEPVVDKMAQANERTLVIAQIESPEGARNARAIAAVDGIDVLWIGHFDLANFAGIPAQFDHPDYRAAEQAVRDACEAEGKAMGRLASTAEEAIQLLDGGYRILAVGLDLDVYRRGVGEAIAATRRHLS
jgi:2-dehydro-3-deoxyglucarate aldolase/4-hydroxy-2-oxoheptanedioate aldolase